VNLVGMSDNSILYLQYRRRLRRQKMAVQFQKLWPTRTVWSTSNNADQSVPVATTQWTGWSRPKVQRSSRRFSTQDLTNLTSVCGS